MCVFGFVKRIVVVSRVLEQLPFEQKIRWLTQFEKVSQSPQDDNFKGNNS
jgi:hypothetical protein